MDTFTLISVIAALASIIGLILSLRNKTTQQNINLKDVKGNKGTVAIGSPHIDQRVITTNTKQVRLPKVITLLLIILLSTLILAYGGSQWWHQYKNSRADQQLNFCQDEDTYSVVIYPFFSYSGKNGATYDFQSAIEHELNELLDKHDLPIKVARFHTDSYLSHGAIQENIDEVERRCATFAIWGYYSNPPINSNQPSLNMHLAIVDPSIFMGMAVQHEEVDLKAINPIEFRQEQGIHNIKDLVLLIGAISAYDRGDFKTADTLFNQIVDKQLGYDCEAVLNYLHWSGLFWYIGQGQRSEALAQQARAITDSLGCSYFAKAQTLEQLGNIQAAYHGNAPKAIELIEQAIHEIQKSTATLADSILPFYYNSLATAHFSNRDMLEARKAQEESLRILQKKNPLTRVDSLLRAMGLVNLASMDMEVRSMDDARDRLTEALAIEKRIYPEQHPSIAQTLNLFSKYHLLNGSLSQALTYQLAILEIREALLPTEHYQMGHAYHNIAFLMKSEPKNVDEALRYAKMAVQNFASQSPVDTLSLAIAHGTVYSIYMQTGDYKQAKTHLQQSRMLKLALLNNDLLHDEFYKGHFDQAEYYYATEDYENAISAIDTAMIIANRLAEKGAASTQDFIILTNSKIKALTKIGKCNDAMLLLPTLKQYHDQLSDPARSKEVPNHALVMLSYARCTQDLALAQEQVAMVDRYFDQQNQPLSARQRLKQANAYQILAELHNQLGEQAKAATYNRKALTLVEDSFPPQYYTVRDMYKLRSNL